MSVVWYISTNNDDISHVSLIKRSKLLKLSLILFMTLKNSIVKVINIINAKGNPKLCAISKNRLCECCEFNNLRGGFIFSLWKLNKCEKVDAPHPKIGLFCIKDIAEFQIWVLGVVLNSSNFE